MRARLVGAGAAALAVGLVLGTAVASATGFAPEPVVPAVAAPEEAPPPAPEPEVSPSETTPEPEPTPPPGPPSDQRSLERVDRITGELTPKSVVASGTGLVVAQNMIYTHTVSAFSSDGDLLRTIDDGITPSEWGFAGLDSPVLGGPVEAAFSPDGSQLWVSNYSMEGPGFPNPGGDVCSPDSGYDNSYLYRIDADTLQIADVVEVGAVPKFVDVTPDGRHVLVTNWCTWDLSIVSTGVDGGEPAEVARVPMGRYPRGIEVSPDSSTAYVAVMGSADLAVVDLPAALAGQGEGSVGWHRGVGRGPRHLNLSPDGSTLYVTLNAEGRVAKVDAVTGEVLASIATGEAPRSAALSPDGTALFVVNYESDTVSRVRTSDMQVLETLPVDHHPIGITYDAMTERVWVAAYGGSLTVFADAP